jgi:hypothetical protein
MKKRTGHASANNANGLEATRVVLKFKGLNACMGLTTKGRQRDLRSGIGFN